MKQSTASEFSPSSVNAETSTPSWFLPFQATARQYVLYVLVFLTWGLISNSIGKALHIAEFGHWWQVATCYVGYLVPVSLVLRRKSLFEQYVYGVFALAPLELIGYSLGTSIAHDNNLFDLVLGPRNFTLAMSVFFGIIPPVGNTIVKTLDEKFGG
ncbi:MAG: hypothetical protein ACKO6N_27230 [Myxococcota bacterium]